jgi:hypothetical protein
MILVVAALMASVANAQTKTYYIGLCVYRFDPLFLFITLTIKNWFGFSRPIHSAMASRVE